MHKRLAALPSRQAAEHRRGGGREMVSIPWVEGRTGGSAGAPGVAVMGINDKPPSGWAPR